MIPEFIPYIHHGFCRGVWGLIRGDDGEPCPYGLPRCAPKKYLTKSLKWVVSCPRLQRVFCGKMDPKSAISKQKANQVEEPFVLLGQKPSWPFSPCFWTCCDIFTQPPQCFFSIPPKTTSFFAYFPRHIAGLPILYPTQLPELVIDGQQSSKMWKSATNGC